MVEIGDPFDRVKGNLIMALCAVLAEFILVRVCMAACTPLIADTFKLLVLRTVFCGHRVAFDAGDLLMLSVEDELCPGMVEQGGRFKGIGIVAVGAGGRKGILVIIRMASQAGRVQPEVGELFAFNRLVGNEFGFMAILALLFCMRTLEVVTGECVVESRGIETDDLEGQPVVVVVTGYTSFPADRSGGMVPFVLVDAGFQFGVAGQAFCIRHLISKFVALGAVREPLEVGMRGGQGAGGDLRTEARSD